jgi:hypothetical protein
MGFVLFLALRPLMSHWDSRHFVFFSIAFILACGGVRTLRFKQIAEGLQDKSRKGWRAVALPLMMMGPAEAIVPLCQKAGANSMGYLTAVTAFGVGTFAMATILLIYGQFAWNEPLKLVRNLVWAVRGAVAFPAFVVLSAGFLLLARLH